MSSSQFVDFSHPQIGKEFEILNDEWAIEVFVNNVEPENINSTIESSKLVRIIAHISDNGGLNPLFRCSIISPQVSQTFSENARVSYVDIPQEFCSNRIKIREEVLRMDKLYRIRKNQEKEAEEHQAVLARQTHLRALEAHIVKADAMIVKLTAEKKKTVEVNKAKKLAAMAAGRAKARDARISASKAAERDRIIEALTKENDENRAALSMLEVKDNMIRDLLEQSRELKVMVNEGIRVREEAIKVQNELNILKARINSILDESEEEA